MSQHIYMIFDLKKLIFFVIALFLLFYQATIKTYAFGGTYYGYYNGFGTPNQYQIGVAISTDGGITFNKSPKNPIITPSVSGWDSDYVKDQDPIKIGNTWYLYYSGTQNGSTYSIGLATSTDGINFTKYSGNPILSASSSGWDAVSTNFPKVYYDQVETDQGRIYKMFYTGQDSTGTQRVGLAFSSDGINWTKYSGNPVIDVGSSGSWEAFRVSNVSTPIRIGSTYYILYGGLNVNANSPTNGRWQIGLISFSSFTGTYTKYSGNPVISRRSNVLQSLTSQTNSGTTTVNVADTSAFQINEPVFIRDTGSNEEFNRVVGINSPTQLTLSTAALRNYPASSTIRSWMYGSIIPNSLEYNNGTWRLWFATFQPFTPTDLLREATAYATSTDGINWSIDYADSPPIPYTDNSSQWDGTSAENLGVILFDPNFNPTAPQGCINQSPSAFPIFLYSAIPNDSTSITLNFSDATAPYDHYALEYGTSSNNYQYGADNIGGVGTHSYQVKSLSANTRYYFRVRAGNGCATGNWSNEISAKTASMGISFASAVSGKLPVQNQINNNSSNTEIIFPSPTLNPTPFISTSDKTNTKSTVLQNFVIFILPLGVLVLLIFYLILFLRRRKTNKS